MGGGAREAEVSVGLPRASEKQGSGGQLGTLFPLASTVPGELVRRGMKALERGGTRARRMTKRKVECGE